jgi:thioesterase domain-containing protein
MTEKDELCQKLETLWHEDFPLTRAMDIHVASFEGHVIKTRSGLAGNTNTHGTAFAGSLYAIEALTAWSLLYLELAMANLDASIIHASGNIEFAKPIKQDIVARSDFAGHAPALERLQKSGKVRLTLHTEVYAGDEVASRFEGVYAVRLNS